jgi:hypothetical protein
MVRYFLTDLRGNPIYSFAQRLRRNRHNNPPLFTPPRRFLSPAYPQDDDEEENAEDLIPAYYSSSSTNRLQSTTNFVSICLVCLIRNQAWDDALKRIQSHPAEILLMDALTGNTVLHTACRLGPPPAIVLALAVDVTARHANYEGATPLHMAASHRCSAASIQALLEVCRTLPADDHGSLEETKHTSPTADLSRMGRAPIHYACMSFRGLDIAAFRLLLDETLREGNVWVWERQDGGDDYLEENHNNEIHSTSLLNQGSKVMEVEEEEEDEMGDENETRDDLNDLGMCEFEYELDRDLYHQYPKSISMEDLTLDGSKKGGSRHPIKVLVNVMGIKDATGQTPLGLLFRRYRERVRCVINTVDKIRKETQVPSEPSTVDRAALVAAIRVHADLGELWEKARWIVARLTEERLLRERLEQGGQEASDHDHSMDEESYPYQLTTSLAPVVPPVRRDATSRRATYFGGSAKAIPSMSPMGRRVVVPFDSEEPPSPVAQEAASWAVELHPTKGEDANSLILPFAPDISTALPDRFLSPTKEASHDLSLRSSSGAAGTSPPPRLLRPNNFRIVHASVGLTGYGCPPELIRLAISIHPNQVMEMDQDGNLPIHIAVTAASYLANANPPVSQREKDEMAGPNDDHSSVISALSFFSSATVSHTSNPFDKVMKILLQHYPAGAWTPQGKTGRLPLVLAVESKGKRTWADGIRTLLQAYPPALHNRKVIEPILYPHVLSLVAAGTSSSDRKQRSRHETCSRGTLFELLRSKPEWLTRGFVEPDRED